jgi:hypothetical protein
MYEDASPLNVDETVSQAWVNDELTWNDVYSKKPEDYLEMIAKGEVPKWDSETKKWVSNSQEETQLMSPSSSTPSEPVYDAQADAESDDDLPF